MAVTFSEVYYKKLHDEINAAIKEKVVLLAQVETLESRIMELEAETAELNEKLKVSLEAETAKLAEKLKSFETPVEDTAKE